MGLRKGVRRMQVTVNGDTLELDSGITVAGLLLKLNITSQAIAVELDREIIDKDKFDETELKPGSVVEIVQFMGGG